MPDDSGGDIAWELRLTEEMERNQPFYQRLAWRIVRDSSAAEDARQEALLNALRLPAERRGIRQLTPWLARLVRNESLLIRRKQKAKRKAFTERPALGCQIESAVRLHDLRESLEAAMKQLPESIRSTIKLRMLDELSGREASKILGCSQAQVSIRLHEGMEALRSALRPDNAT